MRRSIPYPFHGKCGPFSWTRNALPFYSGTGIQFHQRGRVHLGSSFIPALHYATSKRNPKLSKKFIDEGIYEVVSPDAARTKDKKKAPDSKVKKRKGTEKGSKKEKEENEEPKPRITIDVLAMLQEEERLHQGGSGGKRCHGCGVVMQSTDPTGIGFRPAQKLQVEAEGKEAICQRCHYLKYQNKVVPIRIAYAKLKEQLTVIKTLRVLVVKIVDIFDFSGSWIDNFREIVGANPIVLVANKVDLLPPDIGKETTKAWIRQAVKELNLKNVRAIQLLSAKTGKGLGKFAEKLEKLRKGRDVYVMGCTNVGKSTLINRLLYKTKGPKHRLLTTSSIPGTTLNLISFPIGARRKHRPQAHLFDTPGVVNEHQMAHYLTPEELKLATPSKVVKPKIIRLVPSKTLFFGGLARIDYVEGPGPLLFTVFMSHQLPVHPTNTIKADDLYAQKAGVLPDLMPPIGKDRASQMPPFILKEVTLDVSAASYDKAFKDIVFGGLGWLSLTGPALPGETVTIRVGSPCGVGIFLREPLMPMEASLPKREGNVIKHGTVRTHRKERTSTSERSNSPVQPKKEEKEGEKEVKKEETLPKRKIKKHLEQAALELLALQDDDDAEPGNQGQDTNKQNGHQEEEEEEYEDEDEEEDEKQERNDKQRSRNSKKGKDTGKRWKRTKWWIEKQKVEEQKKKEKGENRQRQMEP